MTVEDLLAEGRAALRAGDPVTARHALEAAFAESPTAEVVEGLAGTAYLELDFPQAIAHWERAHGLPCRGRRRGQTVYLRSAWKSPSNYA